jgi:hypothetical protein
MAKKKKDRGAIERRLGKAVHKAGKEELSFAKASKALSAVAQKELVAYDAAEKKLQEARAKIVEINNELSALDK